MEAIREIENVQLIMAKLQQEAKRRIIENSVIYIPLQGTYTQAPKKRPSI